MSVTSLHVVSSPLRGGVTADLVDPTLRGRSCRAVPHHSSRAQHEGGDGKQPLP